MDCSSRTPGLQARSKFWIRRNLTSLALAALVSLPTVALAEGGSVRYSYEKVEIGGKADWVLVPQHEDVLGGKVTNETVQRAFDRLKRAKRATYGNSTIQVTGKSPAQAKAVVRIDPEYARYALIIIAETVYTLTEYGVPGVEFPGHAKGALTRKDIPFAAFTLTLPLWKVLPPGNLTTTQVVMPDGTLVPVEQVYARWRSENAEMRKLVYSYLESDDAFTVMSVARLVPTLGNFDPSQIVPLLTHEARALRRVGLEVLKDQTNNETILAEVVKALQAEKDDEIAREFANYLGQSKSAAYNVFLPLHLLTRGSDEEAAAAAETLGSRKNDERVVIALRAALEDKREPVAMAAATSLGTLSQDQVRLQALASDKIAESVRLKLAEDVTQSKDAAARVAALTYLANNAPGGRANMAVTALGEVGTDDARKSLETFLADKNDSRREAAHAALLKIGKVESLPAISAATKAGDATVLEELGYKIMAAQPVNTIMEQTSQRDTFVQRVAYRALGERAAREKNTGGRIFEILEAGSKHSDPSIRGAAARALGSLATADALAILTRMTEDKAAPVRRDVALALGNYGNGELVEVLVKYLDDSAPGVVAGAIDAMERRQEALSWNKIWEYASNSKDADIRAAAFRALATLVDREDTEGVRQVINLLGGAMNDRNALVQHAAIAQLGRFKEEMAVLSIATHVAAADKALRLAAIRALGTTGHPTATPLVVRALDDADLDVRRAAIEAVANLKDKSARSGLEKRIEQEKDPELVELIRSTLKSI